MHSIRLTAAALLAASALALTGCSAITDLLAKERTRHFPDVSAMQDDWDKSAAWVPADASAIDIREASSGDPAVLRAVTASPLDPELCVEVERRSGPVFDDHWTPEDPYVDRVFACGDWAVMATDDGWYGWTPNHPEEKAASDAIGG